MATSHDQEPLRSPTTSVRNENTGFPEPFNGDRNTTMRHPEADTSLNACIEAEDVPTSRRHSRHHSWFSRRRSHEKDALTPIEPPSENLGNRNRAGTGTGGSETSEEKKIETVEGEEVATPESPVGGEGEHNEEGRPLRKLRKSFLGHGKN